MAKSKDEITYGTAQARLSEDEAVRVAYKHGTPLEAGKIADSQPVDMFSSAHNVSKPTDSNIDANNQSPSQLDQQPSVDFTTGPPHLPQKGPPPTMAHQF